MRQFALILFGALLALCALELALRVTDPIPEVGSPLFSFHDNDPLLGWSGKPNVQLRYHRPEFDTLVRHDAGGWRVPDPPRPNDATRRILVLGDSFTWGWGVSQGEVFTDRLQARLPANVAVYNRGIIGFGNAQEYLLEQRELAAAHYDAVVLMFFINDAADNLDGKDGHRPYFELVDGVLQPRNQPALARTSPVELFMKEHSRAYVFIEFELGMLKRRFAGEADDERRYRELGAVDFHDLPAYGVTARLLHEMHRTAGEHDAEFFLAYIPQRSEFELAAPFPYVRAIHAMIEEIAARDAIPFIDLSPSFHARTQAGEQLVYPIDAHWNADGHRVAAETLLSSPLFAVAHDGSRPSLAAACGKP